MKTKSINKNNSDARHLFLID